MIHFATLYIGSSGNSKVVWDEETAIMIDMGASCKKTIFALGEVGLAASKLDAILVTHEHSDHIGGLQIFTKNYPVPVYGTAETKEYLESRGLVADGIDVGVLIPERTIRIGSFAVTPFSTSHDSRTCCGFRIEKGTGRVAIATDIGKMEDSVFRYLSDCQLVALESNYDEMMLRNGRYPAALKARIAGPQGHLSNRECASTAVRLVNTGMKHLVLMHLSEENNTPAVAETMVYGAFENNELADGCCEVYSAPRFAPSKIWRIQEC